MDSDINYPMMNLVLVNCIGTRGGRERLENESIIQIDKRAHATLELSLSGQ